MSLKPDTIGHILNNLWELLEWGTSAAELTRSFEFSDDSNNQWTKKEKTIILRENKSLLDNETYKNPN